jgi:uncharacterized protein
MIQKSITVVYHGDCPDGFSAAWVAWKKFGAKAEYIGVHHQTSPPEGLEDKEIYFLDFVYPEKIMRKIIKDNKKVVAIDHHISTKHVVELADDHLYDVKHSGAVLAWKYFYPSKSVPNFLKYVEDRDLWNWKMKHAKEVLLYTDVFDFNFNTWNKISFDLDNELKVKEYYEKGSIIKKYESKIIDRLIDEGAESVVFEGHKASLVNASHFFASDIGNALCKKNPPIALIWNERYGMINVSLRSNGTVDVSELAKKYGGGGHKAASGFAFKVGRKAPWSKVNVKLKSQSVK